SRPREGARARLRRRPDRRGRLRPDRNARQASGRRRARSHRCGSRPRGGDRPLRGGRAGRRRAAAYPARRAWRAGSRDGAVRRRATGEGSRPRRAVRRAVHHRPRRRRWCGARGRASCRPPADELPHMVEPPELSNVPRGTVPPPPEPPARRIHVARRRFVALAVIGAAVAAIDKGSKQKPAAAPRRTTGVRALKTFRIIFPEGFTRLQMAQRIKAVDAIARRKRHFNPKLTARTYEAATASSRLPARLAGDKKRRNLEGMLFPAEYELYQNDV